MKQFSYQTKPICCVHSVMSTFHLIMSTCYSVMSTSHSIMSTCHLIMPAYHPIMSIFYSIAMSICHAINFQLAFHYYVS